jgi:hypothetical protein
MPVHKKHTDSEQIFNHENDRGAQKRRKSLKNSEDLSCKQYTAIVTRRHNSAQGIFFLFNKAG